MVEEDNRKLGNYGTVSSSRHQLRAPVPDSITHCFQKLQAGNLMQRRSCGRRTLEGLALARKKMEGRVRRMNDEEDVALSAFRSFCLRG